MDSFSITDIGVRTNDLNNIGLCVSYKTVLQISTSLGNAAIARYNFQEIVCPSRLKFGVVTTVAVDNIDQSTSSMTATSSLHGTAISVTQHPLTSDDGVEQEPLQIKKSSNTKLDSLPEHYTYVPEVVLKERINVSSENLLPSDQDLSFDPGSNLVDALRKEEEWLNVVKEIQNLDSDESKGKIAHWAAFHASHQKGVPTRMVSSAVLPLFYEAAHSASMMKHGIDISLRTTHFLNPGQITIASVDQPLYALCKQLQWQYPEIYGISKAFFYSRWVAYRKTN